MSKKTKVVQLPAPDYEEAADPNFVRVHEIDEPEATVEVLSAKAVATMLGTDGRTLRKYLRSIKDRVGQGNRWEIDPSEVDEIRKGFEAFNKVKPAEVKVLLAPADAEVDEDFEDLLDDEALELEEIEIG